jgi:hypothetical protein
MRGRYAGFRSRDERNVWQAVGGGGCCAASRISHNIAQKQCNVGYLNKMKLAKNERNDGIERNMSENQRNIQSANGEMSA